MVVSLLANFELKSWAMIGGARQERCRVRIMNKIAISALIFALSGPAIAAEPIVLECELPASELQILGFLSGIV